MSDFVVPVDTSTDRVTRLIKMDAVGSYVAAALLSERDELRSQLAASQEHASTLARDAADRAARMRQEINDVRTLLSAMTERAEAAEAALREIRSTINTVLS